MNSINVKRFTLCLLIFLAILAPAATLADAEGCQAASVDCAPIGEWEVSLGVGLGVHTNPLVDGDEVPIVLLPDFSYYGKRFFLDDYQLGFTLVDAEHHAFNAIVTASYDQVYFEDWGLGNFTIEASGIGSLSNGTPVAVVTPTPTPSERENPVISDSPTQSDEVPEFSPDYVEPRTDRSPQTPNPSDPRAPEYNVDSRHMAGLAGFEYGYFNGSWSLGILLLQDFTSVHNGQEARVSFGRGFHPGKSHVDVAAGVVWQSDRLLDYYYGVDPHEVSNISGTYEPESGVSPFFRVDWRRKLSSKWSFQATLHYKWLSPEITDSPIVEDDVVGTVFIGGVYHF